MPESWGPFRAQPLLAAVLLGLASTAATIYIAGHPTIPADVQVERMVQSIGWGPLALSFPVYSFIGDAKAAVLEAVVFAGVLLWNRRAWLLAGGCALTVVFYLAMSHFIVRPRPTLAQVTHVTHLPNSSFPSGHTMVLLTIVVMAMVCLGRRYLDRAWYFVGWAVGLALVLLGAISRVYVGAHWPSDVLAGALIAGAWLCLWISFRPVALGSLES